jgi:glycosyltransferase involved in cell wall biosynthesis
MTVSVVIPNYNGRPWIGRTIDSVLSGGDVEIIVVDDCSTDDSVEFLQKTYPNVTVSSGVKRGPSGSRNHGVSLSQGEYTVFVDCDDYYDPSPLAVMQAELAASGAELCICASVLERGEGVRLARPAFPAELTPEELLVRVTGEGWAPCNAVMWRRRFFETLGGWREDLARNEDGELMARAALAGARTRGVASGLAVYYQHPGPGRVSRRRSSEVFRQAIDQTARLAATIEGASFDIARPTLARSAYELAQEAFVHGSPDLAREALALSRRLGFRGHHGALRHRVLASLLGLEGKERLAGTIRAARAPKPAG